MARHRYRSSWNGLSAIPRLGFLLLLLAIAITVWPRLRSITSTAPSAEAIAGLSASENSLTTLVSANEQSDEPAIQTSDNSEKFGDSAQTDAPEKAGDSANATGEVETDLAIDGQTSDLLSLVTDNAFRMAKREMPAYWELVRRTANSSFINLQQHANAKVKFNDFYSAPAKQRGKLFSLDIVVRRVTRFEAEDANETGARSVYEIWGSTEQSQAWLYVFITDRLPDGFDEKTLLRKKTSFAGYFLKMLAYYPGSAPPNSKPLVAPLLIGRLKDIPLASPVIEDNSSWWTSWGMVAAIVIAIGLVATRFYLDGQQKKRRRIEQRDRLAAAVPDLFEPDRA